MKKKLLLAAMMFVMSLTSCFPYNTGNDAFDTDTSTSSAQTEIVASEAEKETRSATTTAITTSITEITTVSETTTSAATTAEPEKPTTSFSLSYIPLFSNTPYCEVNNKPFFTNDEITTQSYEYYSDLDSLGRCGACIACISIDMMPTTEREGIGMIKPSGWQLSKYDFVDGKYLFNAVT